MENQTDLQRKALKEEAKQLVSRGYSVIPVLGDKLPSNPKRPATAWKRYQKRLADSGEIERWFNRDVTALGIVCGSISRLMVIDFDDYSRYRRFRHRFPEYKNARRVKTRRGYHVYFRTSVKISNQGFDGGDVKGEGGFVIAPPSVIGGVRYECIGGDIDAELDRAEVDEIVNFLVVDKERKIGWLRGQADLDLAALYRRLAGSLGRNNALYRVASIGREAGLSENAAVELLAPAHARQAGRVGLKSESIADRWKESLRTIRSAFAASGMSGMCDGLPNSVRERLLKVGRSTTVARLLDVFGMMGWASGAWRTLREIVDAGKRYGLGRRSTVEVLTGSMGMFRGRPIIKSRYVEYVDSRVLNRNSRGRPVEKLYQIPDVSALVRLLGVRWSVSDKLKPEDLKSAHAYRLALHREYIRRVSPEAPQAWLAERVGLSDRSIRRFNAKLGVQSTVKVGVFDLNSGRLKLLPKRRANGKRWATPGYWLETKDGRRWPAWRHLGKRLLNQYGSDVKVCMRRMSELRLSGSGGEKRESLAPEDFKRVELLRRMKEGSRDSAGVMKELLATLKREAEVARFVKAPLFFESVSRHIPQDRIAETIEGYLVARNQDGAAVRRPALRGVAYRMLKEFGNGNVQLALRDGWDELRYALARHMPGLDEGGLMKLAADAGE